MSLDVRARAATFLLRCLLTFGGLGGGLPQRQLRRWRLLFALNICEQVEKALQKIRELFALCFVLAFVAFVHGEARPYSDDKAVPLVIGETFTINSKALSETRRINVYVPPGYMESAEARLPVLYMPDGGIAEDFLHVAGLVQVSVGNGTMRPFLLVDLSQEQESYEIINRNIFDNRFEHQVFASRNCSALQIEKSASER